MFLKRAEWNLLIASTPLELGRYRISRDDIRLFADYNLYDTKHVFHVKSRFRQRISNRRSNIFHIKRNNRTASM